MPRVYSETRVALRNLVERSPNLRLAVAPSELVIQKAPGWHRHQSLPVALRLSAAVIICAVV